MAGWLAALSGIMTLLLLAFPTFLTALLLLTTILLVMTTLLLLGPFQVLFFLSVHLNLHFSWEKTHSKVVSSRQISNAVWFLALGHQSTASPKGFQPLRTDTLNRYHALSCVQERICWDFLGILSDVSVWWRTGKTSGCLSWRLN
jgi:hypothetical protein